MMKPVPKGTTNHYQNQCWTGSPITVTSQWPRWRLKSPASRLFILSFIQAQIKENIKAPRHWPLCGEFTGIGEFPAHRASNAENVSIWWHHYATPWWLHYTTHNDLRIPCCVALVAILINLCKNFHSMANFSQTHAFHWVIIVATWDSCFFIVSHKSVQPAEDVYLYGSEAGTKWPPFCWRHFKRIY